MSKNDYLFSFIKDLTKNEKRFFRLYSNLYNTGNSKNYLILFDILDKMKTYDAAKVTQQLKKESPKAKLSVVKHYLKQHLFDSLHTFYRKKIPAIQNNNILNTSYMLLHKKQFAEAQRLLLTFKNATFQEYEDHLKIVEINILLNKVQEEQKHRSIEGFAQIDAHYKEMTTALKHLQDWTDIRQIHNHIRLVIYAPNSLKEDIQTTFKELLKTELMQRPIEEIVGIEAQYYFANSLYLLLHFTQAPLDQQIVYLEKMEQLITDNKRVFASELDKGVIYINLLQLYIDHREEDKFTETFDKLSALIDIAKGVEKSKLLYWKYLRLFEFHSTYRKQIALSIQQEVSHLLNEKTSQFSSLQKTGLTFAISIYHFKLTEYQKANDILSHLFLHQSISIQDYYYLSLRLLHILCYYEIGQYTFAQKELLSLKRKLQREELLSDFSNDLLKQLNGLINAQANNHTVTPYYQKIATLLQSSSNKNMMLNLRIEVLVSWVQLKI